MLIGSYLSVNDYDDLGNFFPGYPDFIPWLGRVCFVTWYCWRGYFALAPFKGLTPGPFSDKSRIGPHPKKPGWAIRRRTFPDQLAAVAGAGKTLSPVGFEGTEHFLFH
jgi:hypothetical protein